MSRTVRTRSRSKKTANISDDIEAETMTGKTRSKAGVTDMSHIEKPVAVKRSRMKHTNNLSGGTTEATCGNDNKTPTMSVPLASSVNVPQEPIIPLNAISQLVTAAVIHIGKGNLNVPFKVGNLTFTPDEILHHSSGIIDTVDKKMYSKFSTINKPYGVYSNSAYNYLANHMKNVIGMTYKQGIGLLNDKLGTTFTSSGIIDELGYNDISGTESDLMKLGDYVKGNYEWFANGSVKRPGRGIDVISSSGLSKISAFNGIKLIINKRKTTIEKGGNYERVDGKNKVAQKIAKTKFAIGHDNRRITEASINQEYNLPVEYIDNPSELEEINGQYWKLDRVVGKTKYYKSPIVNSSCPFLVV